MDDKQKREPLRCWIVLVFLSLNYLIIDGIVRSYGLLYLDLLDVFNQGPFVTGWVATTFAISGAAVSPLAGWMSDRFPLYVVLFIGAVGGCVGLLICFFARTLTEVIIFYGMVYGASNTFIFVGTAAATSKIFDKNRSLAVGIMFASGSLGAIIIPFLFSQLLTTFALRGTILISGSLLFHVAVSGAFVWMMLRRNEEEERSKAATYDLLGKERPHTHRHKGNIEVEMTVMNKDTAAPTDSGADAAIGLLTGKEQENLKLTVDSAKDSKDTESSVSSSKCNWEMAKKLCSLKFICALLYWFGLVYGFHGYLQYVPAFVVDRGYSRDMGSLLLSICGAFDLIGRLVMGIAANFRCTNMYLLLSVNLLSASIIIILTYFLPGMYLMGISLALLGLFAGGSGSLLAPVIVDAVGPELVGTGLGLTNICFGAALGLSPVLNGAIRETVGSYKFAPFLAGTALFISCTSIVVGNRDRLLHICRKRRAPDTDPTA